MLYSSFAPITSISGIGAKYASNYANLGITKVVDLLWHLPVGIIDRRNKTTVAEAKNGEIATLYLEVDEIIPPKSRRSPTRVVCHDKTGNIVLVFFKVFKGFLEKHLPIGAKRIVSGRVDFANYGMQMAHPDYIVADESEMPLLETVYPLTAGVSLKMMEKSVKAALEMLKPLPEWLDAEFKKRQGFPDWSDAVKLVHNPKTMADIDNANPARRRLAYDELLSEQLALALLRAKKKKLLGYEIKGDGKIRRKVFAGLPFKLTDAQVRVLKEIETDMARSSPMYRLIQGDVGSGKTIIAFFALLNAVECGLQGAFMVPTEILARQHYAKLKPLADMAGVNLCLLTGRDKSSQKESILHSIKDGGVDIVIGTHSLIQEGVAFNRLGLAVIDEQHRFGVHQRLDLKAKGTSPDMLVMTATPIPRTLALTAYGDMDISIVDEKPKGRAPVKTVALPLSKLDEIISAIKRAIATGTKIYWICPLLEESETLDVAAAKQRFKELSDVFPEQVGLVHGKMEPAEKDEVMAKFADENSSLSILVATTVVEVGVDVPIASVMVIEHAERFGLAQLHQLRGRIGRGSKESSCVLMYGDNLTAVAKARIDIMRKTDDGFKIAEEDLRLRGIGEVLGTKQSGLPEFKLANLATDLDLIHTAAKDAQMIVGSNPSLSGDRGEALRVLLYLFEQDKNVKLMRS